MLPRIFPTAAATFALVSLTMGVGLPHPAIAQTSEAPAGEQPAGGKHALIWCGHPGDAEHQTLYAETVTRLHGALVSRLGFAAENIHLQFGGIEGDEQPQLPAPHGKATREEIARQMADMREKLRPEDALWVIVLGHAHYDGRRFWWNLPGPDLHETELGELFHGLAAREQVFFITTPASGFCISPLSAPGRVVITATEPDLEVNETLFHQSLARLLAEPPTDGSFDADQDGAETLFDLYIGAARDVAQRYLSDELLATEHAQLDDNGDGRGTELQLDYLTEEQGGRSQGGPPPAIRPGADGALAATVRLSP